MRPHIIINVAASINGKISSSAGRFKISDIEDMERVMLLRKSVDAVLIGANTVRIDNPVIKGAHKIIILDGNLALDNNYKIFHGNSQNIYVITERNGNINGATIINVQNTAIEYIVDKIYSMGIKSILVEGGANVIEQFIRAKLFDEFYIFINPGIILNGRDLFIGKEYSNLEYTIEKYSKGILLNIKAIYR